LEQTPIQSPNFHFFRSRAFAWVESRVRAMRSSGWTIGEFATIPKLFPGRELPMDTALPVSRRARVADLQVRGTTRRCASVNFSRRAAPDQFGRGPRVSTAST
jgi:hypothetical protein